MLRIALAAALGLCLAAPLAAFAHGRHADRYAPIDGARGRSDANAAGTPLRRWLPSDYADGHSAMAGPHRPSPRSVSNAVLAQSEDTASPVSASDYVWQWGQFLDHDVDLTGAAEPAEPEDIPVPYGDPYFDPFGWGDVLIPFDRSRYVQHSKPREQENQITGWIDASNVYGSDHHRAQELRTLDGTGRLATSAGDLLPFNVNGLPNAGGPDPTLFLAGDVRANEQVGLTAMHTLFVREHNRIVRKLARRYPRWSGERLYQETRRIVIAQMQVITYHEFLPVLLGRHALPRYRGYRHGADPRVANVFSTAAYRFGHSALSPTLRRLDRWGDTIPEGDLALRDAFFAPWRITDEGGIDPILRGLAAQVMQAVDARVIDDVRNFLFGPPGAGGFDLVSLNIQRGRDHGLPSYNAARLSLGYRRAKDFSDVTSNPQLQAKLASVYRSVDDIDLWVGGLAEDRIGNHMGPLFQKVLVNQFVALRDGDRHYYGREFSRRQRHALRRTRLSHVIRRNTQIGRELPAHVFVVHP
jgi:peroxidase